MAGSIKLLELEGYAPHFLVGNWGGIVKISQYR